VGAIIVNQEVGRIIALGFNGFPTKIADCDILLADKTIKRDRTIHAEENALLFAGRDARKCDLYVVGKPICNRCAMLAIQSGIKRVIALTPMADSEKTWEKAGRLACSLLAEAEVRFVPHAETRLDEAKVRIIRPGPNASDRTIGSVLRPSPLIPQIDRLVYNYLRSRSAWRPRRSAVVCRP
jgi:deoxycytidylate deaminase